MYKHISQICTVNDNQMYTIYMKYTKKHNVNKQKYTRRHIGGTSPNEPTADKSQLASLLRQQCKNADACLALGQYSETIKELFDNFSNLSMVSSKHIKKISSKSTNGFVMSIPFKYNNEYKANVILKSSNNPRADNLVYEYYVGKYFINSYVSVFPNFCETYHLLRYKDIKTHDFFKNYNNATQLDSVDISSFFDVLLFEKNELDSFTASCQNSMFWAIMLQHFDNFISAFAYKNSTLFHTDILGILMQLYFPLCFFGNNYTHYDLHENNVYLYKPHTGNQYCLLKYHLNDGTVLEVPCEYIVKIIDYGRNYFRIKSDKSDNIDTEYIVKNYICGKPSCDPECGKNVGYKFIRGSLNNETYQHISPNVPNCSHDLLFAHRMDQFIQPLLGYTNIVYDLNYGTPFRKSDPNTPNTIHNIFDLLKFVKAKISEFNSDSSNTTNNKYHWNNKYSSWKQASTIDIFENGSKCIYTLADDIETHALPFENLMFEINSISDKMQDIVQNDDSHEDKSTKLINLLSEQLKLLIKHIPLYSKHYKKGVKELVKHCNEVFEFYISLGILNRDSNGNIVTNATDNTLIELIQKYANITNNLQIEFVSSYIHKSSDRIEPYERSIESWFKSALNELMSKSQTCYKEMHTIANSFNSTNEYDQSVYLSLLDKPITANGTIDSNKEIVELFVDSLKPNQTQNIVYQTPPNDTVLGKRKHDTNNEDDTNVKRGGGKTLNDDYQEFTKIRQSYRTQLFTMFDLFAEMSQVVVHFKPAMDTIDVDMNYVIKSTKKKITEYKKSLMNIHAVTVDEIKCKDNAIIRFDALLLL